MEFTSNLTGEQQQQFAEYVASSPLALQQTNDAAKITFSITDALPDSLTSPEAYVIEVTRKGISVAAKSDEGLFYGFQTLLQMAQPQTDGSFAVPCALVEDAPRFNYRGLHLDVSRHYVSNEFIKKQLDAMARYKLNNFHWHITDGAGWRLQIDKYPELTSIAAFRPQASWKDWWKGNRHYCNETDSAAQGGYYTREDVAEILAYARQRHINVIPEIEMPAHSEEVVAVYPELSCYGEPYKNSELCIGNEKTFEFLQDVLLETMDMFDSPYIHIGGDEADKRAWAQCKKCQKRMRDENLENVDELQSYLIQRIQKFVESHGRRIIGWDEILEGGSNPNAIIMSWRGEEGGIKAAAAGHEVIMTPGGYCYLDSYQDAPHTQPEAIGGYLTLDHVYSYNPVVDELKDSLHLLKGIQANVWTEYMPTEEHMEYMMYPRLLAISEVAWTQPENKDWEKFREGALNEVVWLRNKGYNAFDLSKEHGQRKEARQEINHLAKGKKVTYNKPYSKYYPANDSLSLTDGWKGGWSYHDMRWQGFLNRDVDVVIDLEKIMPIQSISADFFQLAGPHIWLPKEVIFSVSTDGESYEVLKSIPTEVPVTEDKFTLVNYEWKGEAKARYIRCQGLTNGTRGSWIFTDEIVVF